MKKINVLFVAFALFSANLFSNETVSNSLAKLLGTNNVGREFYFSCIPAREDTSGNNEIKLYISSGVETMVRVEIVGKGYEKIKKTIPNDIIEFTLSPAIGQPYRKTDSIEPEVDQVWRGAGIHVIADDPIICYCFINNRNYSAGFLNIPVPALGKEYIVSSYADYSDNINMFFPGYVSVTAAYDKTKVRFTLGGSDSSKIAGELITGETSVYNLNNGDVLLIASSGKGSDLSGSKISATKPVAVVSGNYCAFIPDSSEDCDLIEEMLLPTNTWGNEYHVPNFAERKRNSMIKVFAKDSSTKIYRDYNQIGFISTAGGTEGVGYLHMRADEGEPRPIVISGDKPISVTQYNTGQMDDSVGSDPFQLVLTPIEQYQREIVFNTPGILGGFGFTMNYINLCYEATEWGTIPEDLMFAQVEGGEFAWLPLVDMSPSPGQPFEKIDGGKVYYSKQITLPGDGVFKIKAEKPFAAYAYGYSFYSSYAFPTSVALGEITKVDTLPPEPKWTMDCWGYVNNPANPTSKTKYVTDKPDDPENRSNLSTIYLHSDVSYNYKLYYGDFMPCEDPVTIWYMRTIDNTEDAFAAVTFADCAGNDTTLYIHYYAIKLEIIPGEVRFENVEIGETYEKKIWIYNRSENAKPHIHILKLTGNNSGFELTDTNYNEIALPFIFQTLDSIPLILRFTATVDGWHRDTILINDSCCSSEIAPVEAYTEGTGVKEKLGENQILISPNPAQDKLVINNDADIFIEQVKIFDLLSNERVCTIKQSEEGTVINTSNLQNGIYIVQIKTQKSTIVRKFIIQK
ncbi:T9SS type A sorting domain-containing protein [Bacteroidota bacterium]